MSDVAQLLKKVRRIEIIASRAVNDLFAGQYKSAFRGRGMEFDEVREYQPGDEIRTIDWNVTARAGKPFIKRFVEERELTILFLVDISASGLFGSGCSKLETAAEVAATLMFSALKNNDKVGLITFAENVIHYLPPRKGKANVLRLIRELLDVQPAAGRTSLRAALEYVNRIQKRRCVIFLLSDFLVPELNGNEEDAILFRRHPLEKSLLFQSAQLFRRSGTFNVQERTLLICSRKHDIVAMHLSDKREKEFPNVGFVMLRDAETGELLEVDTSSLTVRQELARQFQAGQNRINETLQRCRIDRLDIETGSDFHINLRRFFLSREHKRRR